MPDFHMFHVILFHFTWLRSLLQWDPIIKVIEIFHYYINISHGKITDFVSIPLLGFTIVIKLRNFDFENHWNILIFFDTERYGARFK